MTKQVESGNVMRKDDQSVVVVKPKHYVGTSGSVWASNEMTIYHQYPHLYEVEHQNAQHPFKVKQMACCAKNYTTYFMDTYETEDVQRVQKSVNCIHKKYELLRLTSLIHGLNLSVGYGSEINDVSGEICVNKIKDCLRCALSVKEQMPNCMGSKLVSLYTPLVQCCNNVIAACDGLKLPDVKSIIGELTDAGPGVGTSNYEVQIRMAEMSRIHKTVRRTRIHRSRDDSAQNEAERTNACIGEALVDGGALQWQYHKLDNLPQNELEKMTIQDIENLEEEFTQKNVLKVCCDVKDRIHMEPGPANDLMLAFVDDTKKNHFFYNTDHLVEYHKAGKEKRRTLPGYNYFKKIENFMDNHSVRGELF